MNPSSSRTNPNPDRHHEEDETHSTPYSHSAAGHSDEEDYGDIFEEDTAAHVAFRGKSRKRAEKQLKAMWGHLKDLSHEPVELTKATSRTIQKCFKRPKLRRDITDVMANNEFFYDIVFSVSLATVRSEFVTSYLECPQGEDCNPGNYYFDCIHVCIIGDWRDLYVSACSTQIIRLFSTLCAILVPCFPVNTLHKSIYYRGVLL